MSMQTGTYAACVCFFVSSNLDGKGDCILAGCSFVNSTRGHRGLRAQARLMHMKPCGDLGHMVEQSFAASKCYLADHCLVPCQCMFDHAAQPDSVLVAGEARIPCDVCVHAQVHALTNKA